MKPKLTGLRNDIRAAFRHSKTVTLSSLYTLLWHYERSQIRYALWHLSSKGEIIVIKSCLYKAAFLRWEDTHQFSTIELERCWPCGRLPGKEFAEKLAWAAQFPKQWRSRTVRAGRSFGQDDSPAR